MDPVLAAFVTGGIVLLAGVLGVAWTRRDGRARHVRRAAAVTGEELATGLGARVTFLQFSTGYCAPCTATHRMLAELSMRTAGAAHIDIDLADRPDLARRFGVLQAPTTLLLDADGVPRDRIAGAPRPVELRERVARILEERHVVA